MALNRAVAMRGAAGFPVPSSAFLGGGYGAPAAPAAAAPAHCVKPGFRSDCVAMLLVGGRVGSNRCLIVSDRAGVFSFLSDCTLTSLPTSVM